MDFQPLTWRIMCYTNIAFNVFRLSNSITLTLSTNDNFEGTDVTLRCHDDGKTLGVVRWTKIHPEQLALMTIQNNVCVSSSNGFLQNSLLYSFDCTDGTVYALTIRRISREMNGQIWTCDLGLTKPVSNEVVIYVKVPVSTTTINPNNNLITSSENSTLFLTCTTSECRPKPKFFWYKDNSVMTDGDETVLSQSGDVNFSVTTVQTYTSSFNIKMTRELNGWYLFCSAGNFNGSFVLSKKILLNITYPPERSPSIGSLPKNSEITLLLGDVLHLVCSIMGGNPLPMLQWNQNNESPMYTKGDTASKNISWQATGLQPFELICRSLHPDRNDAVSVKIDVLYPPGPPEIAIQTSSGSFVHVNKTFSVIEGRPFTLNCSAKSNPPVSLYRWNNLLTDNFSIFYASPDRFTISVSCYVSNVMRISDSRPVVIGSNITFLDVNVLYPPTMNTVRDATLVEGENLDILCNFVDGNPRVTKIAWSWQGITWNVNPLLPKLVSRNQTGLYRCTVQNVMASSDGTQVVGNASGELYLSVQFKSTVLRFVINEDNNQVKVTVNENDTVNLTCEIEGLPIPTGQLHHQSMFNQNVENISRYSTLKTATHLRLNSVFQAQCTDNGIHMCSGTNTLYNGLQSTSNKNVSLSVMCKPRKSPFFTILDTVQSPTSVDATLSFTAVAYPVPANSGYVWSRKLEINHTWETWENITTSGQKFIITTLGLQSNLTIKDVSQLDYGLYRLCVDNGIGNFNFTFGLIPSVDTNVDNLSSNTGVIAGVVGTVVAVVILVTIIVIVIVYRRRSATTTRKRDSLRHYYNCTDKKVGELNITLKASNANEYEELQHRDFDQQYERMTPVVCEIEKVESDSLSVYEGLQTTGSDHQYARVSPVALKVGKDDEYSNPVDGGNKNLDKELQTKGPHMIYENLQITRNTEGFHDGGSSQINQTAAQTQMTQSSV